MSQQLTTLALRILVFGVNQNLLLTFTFYQADGTKYANSAIDINLLPIQIPPT